MDSFPKLLMIKKYWNTRRFFGGAAMISAALGANLYVEEMKSKYIKERNNEGSVIVVISEKDKEDADIRIFTSNGKEKTEIIKICGGHVITAGTEKEHGGGDTDTPGDQIYPDSATYEETGPEYDLAGISEDPAGYPYK